MKAQPAELTAEEKRIKIAEACGWKRIELCTCKEQSCGTSPTGKRGKHLPDYFASLDACAEMRKALANDEQQHKYAVHLRRLVWVRYFDRPVEDGVGILDFWISDAPPADHCEAFARTLNLWRLRNNAGSKSMSKRKFYPGGSSRRPGDLTYVGPNKPSPEAVEAWKKFAETRRKERKESIQTHSLKCPHCGAFALNLWHIHGQQYFKCGACGKEA